jgi:general secretion pathway protein G
MDPMRGFQALNARLSHRLSRPRGAAGFTLLEMLVVLVIIGLIAGLVGPQLLGRVDTSKVTTADTQVRMLKGALDTMRLDIGRFPTKEEGLELLMTAPRDEKLARRWRGPYLTEAIPLDPWGNPYQYSPDTSVSVILYSYGADGRPGGEGVDADVGFTPKQLSSN